MDIKRQHYTHPHIEGRVVIAETGIGTGIYTVEGDPRLLYGYFAECDLCGMIDRLPAMAESPTEHIVCGQCVTNLGYSLQEKAHAAKRQEVARKFGTEHERATRHLPDRVTKATQKFVLARDTYRCRYCGKFDPHMALDHLIPQIQGGTHEVDNLVACCGICNSSKGGRTPEQAGMKLLPAGTTA